MVDDQKKLLITKALAKTSINLSKARDFDTIAEILFNFVQQIVPMVMAVLYILESDGQTLKPLACRGTKIEFLLQRNLFHLGEGGVGYVGREKKVLLLTDTERSINFPIQIRQVKREDPIIRSFLAVPLIVNNRLIGVLSVSSSEPNKYTMHDVELVSIVANQVAALVELYSQVQKSQRFSDHILENISSGVIVTDKAGIIIMINRMGELITGYTNQTIRGKPLLLQPFFDPATRWIIQQYMQGGEGLYESPGIVFSKADEKKSIRISSSLLSTGKENDKGYIFIFRDMTQMEQLHERLNRYQKMVTFGKWTSCISHEIRNSLLPIRTSVQLLKKRVEPLLADPQLADLMDVLETESERLNRFLNELSENRDFSQQPRDCALLCEALEETLSLVQSQMEENRIRCQVSTPAPFWVPLPKDQLKQIFLNLFLNSIDALEHADKRKERRIKIEVVSPNEQAEVHFYDNGIGIPQKYRDSLFDPFFTTKEKGTGLGLYNIQKQLLEVGGDIRVDSEEGRGTLVTMLFPIKNIEGEP